MSPATRRILSLTHTLPLAAAVLLATLRLGSARRDYAAAADVAAAEAAAAAYGAVPGEAAGRGESSRNGRSPGTATGVEQALDALRDDGYDATLYLAGRRGAAAPGAFGPDTLPRALMDTLEARDGAFAFTLSGAGPAALAPLRDADGWGIAGAILVARRSAAPPRLPAVPLVLGTLAWLVATWGAFAGASLRRYATRRERWRLGVAIVAYALAAAPAFGFAAYLLGPAVAGLGAEAGAVRFHTIVVFGAWAALAAIGASLLHVADSRLRLREAVRAWAFLAPSFAHLLLFSVGPILFSLWLSFHRWNLVEPQRPFVGLGNYAELLGDAPFWNAVKNTAVYVLFVPIGMAVALALALLANRRIPGVRLLRTAFFLPYVTSFVAISLVWKWMFEPDFGLLNHALGWLGIPPQPWLSSPASALPSLMLMSVWMYAGYMMIIFLAGLQNIPQSLYDSARIDGAGAWRRFTRITLPLLRPTTFFVLVTMIIFMFQAFTAIYVMTEGGPLHATDVIVYHIYRNAWEYLRMGYASAMAWVLFLVVFMITLVQLRVLGERVRQ